MPLKHRRSRAAVVGHLLLGLLPAAMLVSCGGGREASPTSTSPPISAAATSTTRLHSTAGALAIPDFVSTTSSSTTALENDGPGGDLTPGPGTLAQLAPRRGGDASVGYGPFGPFELASLSTTQRQAIDDAVDRWIDDALLEPLRFGTRADLSQVVTAGVSLTSSQRGVLTEDGQARLAEAFVSRRLVQITGIVGPDASAVAVATVDVVVEGRQGSTSSTSTTSTPGTTGTPTGKTTTTTFSSTTSTSTDLMVRRTGTLLMVPAGVQWRIDAFELHVERDA